MLRMVQHTEVGYSYSVLELCTVQYCTYRRDERTTRPYSKYLLICPATTHISVRRDQIPTAYPNPYLHRDGKEYELQRFLSTLLGTSQLQGAAKWYFWLPWRLRIRGLWRFLGFRVSSHRALSRPENYFRSASQNPNPAPPCYLAWTEVWHKKTYHKGDKSRFSERCKEDRVKRSGRGVSGSGSVYAVQCYRLVYLGCQVKSPHDSITPTSAGIAADIQDPNPLQALSGLHSRATTIADYSPKTRRMGEHNHPSGGLLFCNLPVITHTTSDNKCLHPSSLLVAWALDRPDTDQAFFHALAT